MHSKRIQAKYTKGYMKKICSKNVVRIANIIGIIIVLAVIGAYTVRQGCPDITCISIYDKSGWQMKHVEKLSETTTLFTAEAPRYTVRITKTTDVSPDDAVLLTRVRVMQISGLFDTALSPYPGVVSDRIECDEDAKPEIQKVRTATTEVTYYTTWVNDRMQPGSCIEADRSYRSLTAHFYCFGHKALYQLELITAPEKNMMPRDELISSIACQPAGIF